QHAPATLAVIGVPVRRIKFARKDAEAGGLRTRRGREKIFQLDAERREAAVEADLHRTGTLGKRDVNLVQFRAREAKRLLNQDMSVGSEGRLHQRRVQVMASGDENCAWSDGLRPGARQIGVRLS